MINVIFWGIIAFLVMICESDDDAGDNDEGKFFLLLGIVIVLAIYGVYTGSTFLMVVFGIPVLCILAIIVWLILYWIFHEDN